jgi:hypothetical protein
MDQTDETYLPDEEGDETYAPTFRERAGSFFRAVSGWTAGLLTLGVMVSLAAGFGPMRAKASQITSTPVHVKFTWPPLAGYTTAEPIPGQQNPEPNTWLNPEMRADLVNTALGALKPDPFDRDSLESAKDALARTGWFRDDLRLTRGAEGMVKVTGSWRVPAAAVRCNEPGGLDVLVTSLGEVLPVKYRPETSGYKVIIGASGTAPAPGKTWMGGEVQAGLRLLDLLATLPPPCPDQIAGVDVSSYGSSRSLVIVTDLGNKILWGGPLDDFNPGQTTPAVKLARLGEVWRESGRIDAGRSVLDVRLLDGVYVHDTLGVMARAQIAQPQTKPAAKTAAKPDPEPAKPRKSGSR